MTNPEFNAERAREFSEQLDQFKKALKPLLSQVAEARRKFARSRSDGDRAEMQRLENEARELLERQRVLGEDIRAASGLPDELFEELDKPQIPGDGENRLQRNDLIGRKVAVTGFVEDRLADALDTLKGLLPPGWLEEGDAPYRLDALISGSECLSLVKGLRRESEFSALHRLRQMVRVAEDFQNEVAEYDHFAGATLVPQLVQLGIRLGLINNIKGRDDRLERLRHGNGEHTDANSFELLVAAGCVECGRDIEFLPETHEKSPDIRCHDPYPMVIECKRKRALADYELDEEAAMRDLFLVLEAEARKKGLCGRFAVRLTVEARSLPVSDVVASLIRQRLAAHPEQPLNYPWGSVAYVPLPSRMALPGVTRLYSPNMLSAVFGWNSDLPEWDGIVCRAYGGGDAVIDQIERPIALVWSNVAESAIRKRSWSPLDLFGDAMSQIPPGEFGIVYLAYHEGTRAEIADRRVDNFLNRIREWEHDGSIRVPISFLVRLYPRPLEHGIPDLIESTVRLCSANSGEPALFEDFPNSVFTNVPLD